MQHTLNKHRKKRFDPYSGDETLPEFQVAPMVDVLLVLLLFFMATATTELVVRQPDLILPQANEAKESPEHAGQSVINVGRLSSQIRLGEQSMESPENLVPYLQKAKESDRLVRGNSGGDYRVLIRAAKKTNYSLIKEIMQACARAGIGNVTFAVTKGPAADGGSN